MKIEHSQMTAFGELGGRKAESAAELAKNADAVFVMVMTGDEAKEVILGDNGLLAHLPKGGAVILSATIKPSEAQQNCWCRVASIKYNYRHSLNRYSLK